jgi:hypothetical protein
MTRGIGIAGPGFYQSGTHLALRGRSRPPRIGSATRGVRASAAAESAPGVRAPFGKRADPIFLGARPCPTARRVAPSKEPACDDSGPRGFFGLGFAGFLLLLPFVLFDAMDIDGSGPNDPAETSRCVREASANGEDRRGAGEDGAGRGLPASRGHAPAIGLLALSAPPSLIRRRSARRGVHPHRAISRGSARPARGSDPAKQPI